MTRARPTRFEAVAVGFDMALSRRVPQGEGLRSDLSLQSLSEDSRGTTTEMAALTIVSFQASICNQQGEKSNEKLPCVRFLPLFMKVERVSPLTIHLNANNTNTEELYYS